MSNVASQGLSIITGQQKGFSWSSVVVSAMGGAVGNYVGGKLDAKLPSITNGTANLANNVIKGVASNIAGNVASQLTQIAIDGRGRLNWSSVAVSGIYGAGSGLEANRRLEAQRAAQGLTYSSNQAGGSINLSEVRPIGVVIDNPPEAWDNVGKYNPNGLNSNVYETAAEAGVTYTSDQFMRDDNATQKAVAAARTDASTVKIRSASMPTDSAEGSFLDSIRKASGSADAEFAENVREAWEGKFQKTFKIEVPMYLDGKELFTVGDPVHNSISSTAAKLLGLRDSEISRLVQGTVWPDMPYDKIPSAEKFAIDFTGRFGNKDSLTYRSHHGDLQFWHSMASNNKMTNGQVLEQVIDQARDWYNTGIKSKDVFYVGKMLHMIQDSFSASHVERDALGKVKRFQNYVFQDGGLHGHADEIGKYGEWVNIPGALPALNASKDLLGMFVSRQPFSRVESYLREQVYQMAPFAAGAKAGGSVQTYEPKPFPKLPLGLIYG